MKTPNAQRSTHHGSGVCGYRGQKTSQSPLLNENAQRKVKRITLKSERTMLNAILNNAKISTRTA